MAKVMRSIKNVTKGYSSVQVKVRNGIPSVPSERKSSLKDAATSNDPWGPSGTEMSEIAKMTFNSANEYYEIMDMLDKRLNDKGRNWRHVLKSLKVLEYCLLEGSELVVTWAHKNIYIIKTLRDFQYIDEDGQDVGQMVRTIADELRLLILDEERLKTERSDTKAWKARVTGLPYTALKSSLGIRARAQRTQSSDKDDGINEPGIGMWDTSDDITKVSATSTPQTGFEDGQNTNPIQPLRIRQRVERSLSSTEIMPQKEYAKAPRHHDESLPQYRLRMPQHGAEKTAPELGNLNLSPHHSAVTDIETESGVSGSEPPATESSKTHSHLSAVTPKDLTVVAVSTHSLADVPLEIQRTGSTEASIPNVVTELKLGDYFKDGKGPPDRFTDVQCGDIARLLAQSGRLSWSAAPRIYIILRLIGQLHLLDAFLDHGINDLWLPFSTASLPRSLSLAYHEEFLKKQTLVLTKAINLENGSKGHAHFTKNDPFPFEVQEILGEGGFGFVDKIVSPLSGRTFARKRFRRPRGQKKAELESFMNELKILKRLHHIHCVSLIASYTDPKYFGIIIAPVADCDLAAFYPKVTTETASVLRGFFGCLANAINFLHGAKIRHRDIKPQNILVKGSSIYLTDFGISLDWENLSRSTTTKDTAKSMLYCAPEVARYEPRNTSADIWSLGCVFLEMLTIIKGKTLEEQRSLFKERSDNYRFYENISTARSWVDQLRGLKPEDDPDNLMADVILEMLQSNADDRIPAAALSNKISRYQTNDSAKTNPICGECCTTDTLSISDSGSDRDPFEDSS